MGVARISLKERITFLKLLTTMFGQRTKFWGFGLVKNVKFDTLSMISHAQRGLSQNLFFIHITPRTFRLGKSLRPA